MEACKMCWKTKEVSAVFAAYPRAVEFCKGCAFDIHRVVNAIAYALDTSGFALTLVGRQLKILDLSTDGTTFVNLLTGELAAELGPRYTAREETEKVRVFQEVAQGGVEGESPERGLEEGQVLSNPPDSPLGATSVAAKPKKQLPVPESK